MDEEETVPAYRPICTADALYGLDLGLKTKNLLSHFLIRLKLFHVKSGRLRLECWLWQRVKGPNLLLGGLK